MKLTGWKKWIKHIPTKWIQIDDLMVANPTFFKGSTHEIHPSNAVVRPQCHKIVGKLHAQKLSSFLFSGSGSQAKPAIWVNSVAFYHLQRNKGQMN